MKPGKKPKDAGSTPGQDGKADKKSQRAASSPPALNSTWHLIIGMLIGVGGTMLLLSLTNNDTPASQFLSKRTSDPEDSRTQSTSIPTTTLSSSTASTTTIEAATLETAPMQTESDSAMNQQKPLDAAESSSDPSSATAAEANSALDPSNDKSEKAENQIKKTTPKKKKKKKKKNKEVKGIMMHRWAKAYKSNKVDSMIVQTFANLPGASAFNSLRTVAYQTDATGAATSAMRLPDEAPQVAKDVLKTLTRLLREGGPTYGVGPQLESFLWKCLSEQLDEFDGDVGTRNFYARCLKVSNALERIDMPVLRGGWTHLLMAIRSGDADVVASLLIGGADVNIPTEDGTYPAHVALDRWAELNMKQHRAECRPGFGVQIGYIIDDPYLNTKIKEPMGYNLLFTAIRARHLGAIKSLIEQDPALLNPRGKLTPLLHRAVNPSEIIINAAKWQIGHGNHYIAETDFECEHDSVKEMGFPDDSILHSREFIPRHNTTVVAEEVNEWASSFVNILIEAGIDLEIKDRLGRTALHIAGYHGNMPAAKLLVEAGANKDALDTGGLTPAMTAMDAGFVEVAAYLAADISEVQKHEQSFSPTYVSRRPGVLSGWGPDRAIPVVRSESNDRFRCDLDVREDLTFLEFKKEYYNRRRPVLIKNGLKNYSKFTSLFGRESLVSMLDDRELQIARVHSNKPTKSSEKSLKAFLKYIKSQEHKVNFTHRDSSYSSDSVVEARFNKYPEFHRAVMSLMKTPSPAGWLERTAKQEGLQLNNYQINIGVPYSGTSAHFHYATMSTLLHGRKRWYLMRPNDAYYSRAHFFDDFPHVQMGEYGAVLECMQQSDDVLFIPSLWGHAVLYEQTSISASFLYG